MKNAWVKVSQLVVPDVTDMEMVLIHLLWFQSIKKVVIYDADPLSGAVLICLNFDQLKKGVIVLSLFRLTRVYRLLLVFVDFVSLFLDRVYHPSLITVRG